MRELSIVSSSRLSGESGYVHGVKCYFRLMGLRAGNFWSTMDYMNWMTTRQNEFRDMIQQNHERVDDFWSAFDKWLDDQVEGNTYTLYQPTIEFAVPLSALKKWGLSASDTRYDFMWSGKLKPDIATAQEIASEFNKNRPATFKGRDISIGDVIVLSLSGVRTAWFYDTDGFVQIHGFERLRWKQQGNIKENRRNESRSA